jgi:hypothetical protein
VVVAGKMPYGCLTGLSKQPDNGLQTELSNQFIELP